MSLIDAISSLFFAGSRRAGIEAVEIARGRRNVVENGMELARCKGRHWLRGNATFSGRNDVNLGGFGVRRPTEECATAIRCPGCAEMVAAGVEAFGRSGRWPKCVGIVLSSRRGHLTSDGKRGPQMASFRKRPTPSVYISRPNPDGKPSDAQDENRAVGPFADTFFRDYVLGAS